MSTTVSMMTMRRLIVSYRSYHSMLSSSPCPLLSSRSSSRECKPLPSDFVTTCYLARLAYFHSFPILSFKKPMAPWPGREKKSADVINVPTSSFVPDVTVLLLDSDGTNIGVMSKEEAEIKANERKMKVFLVDAASKPHPTFKMLTKQEVFQEELKQKRARKAESESHHSHWKVIEMKSSIQQHDLQVKIDKINILLNKGDSVVVRLTSKAGNESELNELYAKIHEQIHSKETSIIIEQKRDTALRFRARRELLHKDDTGHEEASGV